MSVRYHPQLYYMLFYGSVICRNTYLNCLTSFNVNAWNGKISRIRGIKQSTKGWKSIYHDYDNNDDDDGNGAADDDVTAADDEDGDEDDDDGDDDNDDNDDDDDDDGDDDDDDDLLVHLWKIEAQSTIIA